MEEESLSSSENKLLDFVRKNILIVSLFSFGVILLGIGIVQMMGKSEAEVKFEEGEDISSEAKSSEIMIDVDGAVVKPGLYSLEAEARLADAIKSAGGLTEDADRKAINLAARISDGQKVYVPKVGESVPESISAMGSGHESSGSVSINSSSTSELEGLPGIGPVTAAKIIDGRPYASVDELREREVVGEKTFEKIVDLISL